MSACLVFFAVAASAAECLTVPTDAPHNREAKFWYHVPSGYDTKRKNPYPVLVYFGGRNCSGEEEASGKLGWSDWADANGVFLIAPGFQNDDYWEPDKWSGQALFDAVIQLKRKYRIADTKLLYYGYSAGSQAANIFPAWRPRRCLAWASHACGVFREPSVAMRGVPGLVTCGDADSARYIISRSFVSKARRMGMDIIWKSFPNHPHDVPPDSLALARAFFSYHLERIGGQTRGKKAPFTGDDQDGVYYPSDSAEAEYIDPEDRVVLPSASIAKAWGVPAMPNEKVESVEDTLNRLRVGGVEFVCRVPKSYAADSRIVVCFGGRGWSGEKTLKEFGFGELADKERVFLVSPSFSKGEYWRPETGTGAKLANAAAELRKRYGLKTAPLVLYGYSAGGQCAALFAQFRGLDVSAWGAHGCGVFPDAPVRRVAALVTCGEKDSERMAIGRQFAFRYREGGGHLLLKPFSGGHELDAKALAIAREWLRAVLCGGESWIWGEDDTFKVMSRESIDVEYRNPLYTRRLADLWQE